MPRVRFIDHVMGLPAPTESGETIYHAGQVAEIPDALMAVIEAVAIERDTEQTWVIEYAGPAERCPGCGSEFVPGQPVISHRMWYHGESLAQVAAERRNAQKPKGDHDLVCIECTRTFPDEHALKVHRGHVHIDRKSGTGPP